MSETKQISIRLDTRLLERAERLSEPIADADPKVQALAGDLTRVDLLRMLILRGIKSYEDELDIDPNQLELTDGLDDD